MVKKGPDVCVSSENIPTPSIEEVKVREEIREVGDEIYRNDQASAILKAMFVLGQIPGYNLSFLRKCLSTYEKNLDLSDEDYKRTQKIFDIVDYSLGTIEGPNSIFGRYLRFNKHMKLELEEDK